jgi:hypothetical protein
MGISTYDIVLLEILFFKKLRACNDDFKFQQGHINFGVVNDPAEIVLARPMTSLKLF